MTKLTQLSDDELQSLRDCYHAMLTSVVSSLEDRANMQDAVCELLTSETLVETLVNLPDENVAQASLAALANGQTVFAIDAEFRRRAEQN